MKVGVDVAFAGFARAIINALQLDITLTGVDMYYGFMKQNVFARVRWICQNSLGRPDVLKSHVFDGDNEPLYRVHCLPHNSIWRQEVIREDS